MNKIDELRSKLQEEQRSRRARQDNGRLGEIIVESWLREDSRLDIQPLPQEQGTKRFLLPEGGKRPDFAVECDSRTFFVDAKLHQTNNLKQFSLDANEVADFRKAMAQLEISMLFIALLSREAIDCLFLIELGEIEYNNEHGPAGIFNLNFADNLRRFGPISRESFGQAVDKYRREGFSGDVPDYPAAPTP